jgi:hypothetical protein
MTEYIKNIIPRLKGFSEKVNKEELLIGKTWVWVGFNKGYSTLHFLGDKRLLISQLGDVQEGSWEFIGNNHLLHLKGSGFSVLLNHGILFKGVLIMQKQGVFDSFEVLYDEQVIPNGDVIKYIEDHLPSPTSISSGSSIPKNDYPYTVSMGEVEITLHQEPRVGMTIYSSEKYSGKVYGLPEYMGVDIQDNQITKVFVHLEVSTEKGNILVEIDNCDLDNPTGTGVFIENHELPNGKLKVKKIEPFIAVWEEIQFENGRIKSVHFLNIINTVLIVVLSLMIVGSIYELIVNS